MPDTTASHNMPDSTPPPAPQASALAARVALESAPRQHSLPEHTIASGLPLPPPWPSLDRGTGGMAGIAGMAPVNGGAVNSGAGELDGIDGADAADDEYDMYEEDVFMPRDPNDRATRPIFAPEQWVSDPDFWESKTHIALTGRHPVPRPKTIALKPPQRFHPVSRWRSIIILLLVCLLIVFAIAGGMELARLGTSVLGPTHHATPVVPTHTLVVPTATPHHKK